MSPAESCRSGPVSIRTALAVATIVALAAALVAGCNTTTSPPPKSGRGPVMNYVSIETVGTQYYVRVYNPDTQSSNNVVHPGQKIVWQSSSNWGDFCVVFSRKDNPDGSPNWKFRHNSQGSVSMVAPPVAPGHRKVFKYSIVGFVDVPASPSSDGGPTSTVAVTADDPFIIIQN